MISECFWSDFGVIRPNVFFEWFLAWSFFGVISESFIGVLFLEWFLEWSDFGVILWSDFGVL